MTFILFVGILLAFALGRTYPEVQSFPLYIGFPAQIVLGYLFGAGLWLFLFRKKDEMTEDEITDNSVKLFRYTGYIFLLLSILVTFTMGQRCQNMGLGLLIAYVMGQGLLSILGGISIWAVFVAKNRKGQS